MDISKIFYFILNRNNHHSSRTCLFGLLVEMNREKSGSYSEGTEALASQQVPTTLIHFNINFLGP